MGSAAVARPAVGQGALGIECRAEDQATRALLAPLDDPDTRRAVLADCRASWPAVVSDYLLEPREVLRVGLFHRVRIEGVARGLVDLGAGAQITPDREAAAAPGTRAIGLSARTAPSRLLCCRCDWQPRLPERPRIVARIGENDSAVARNSLTDFARREGG